MLDFTIDFQDNSAKLLYLFSRKAQKKSFATELHLDKQSLIARPIMIAGFIGTMNVTASINRTNGTDQQPANAHILYGVTVFSIVYVFVLMIPTVIINAMTLFAVYKDPLKCFTKPLGMFSAGVIAADFILALIVFPFFGAADAIDLRIESTQSEGSDNYVSFVLYYIGSEVLMGAIITSFLTLLGLAVLQLIAVRSPMTFERYVTDRAVNIALIVIWNYAIVFVLVTHFLPSNGSRFMYIWFIIVHVSMVTVILVIVYIVTYVFFVVRATRQPDEENGKQITREFFKGTCMLSFLQILLVWPAVIMIYVGQFLDTSSVEMEVNLLIAQYICDDILFFKFLLDPIILIWRVPLYKRAIKTVYWRIFGLGDDGNVKGRISYNRANVPKKDDDSSEDVDVEVL